MAKKWVRTPFWGDFGFFWPSENGKRRMFPRTQHWPLSKTPFVLSRLLCGVSPSRHTHRREKTSDRKQLDSGGWGCRMTRLFSHENGLYTLHSLKPAKFPLRGPRRGCFAPPRRPEAHPDRHYHPRHFRKRSRCPGPLKRATRALWASTQPRHRRRPPMWSAPAFPSSAHTFLSDILPSCTVAARERLTHSAARRDKYLRLRL